jgi:hypothetical protein
MYQPGGDERNLKTREEVRKPSGRTKCGWEDKIKMVT